MRSRQDAPIQRAHRSAEPLDSTGEGAVRCGTPYALPVDSFSFLFKLVKGSAQGRRHARYHQASSHLQPLACVMRDAIRGSWSGPTMRMRVAFHSLVAHLHHDLPLMALAELSGHHA